MDFPYLEELAAWINGRWAIRLKREQGAPPPWTTDPILRDYRFCNVHREDDRVTRWLARHWRDPNADHDGLWHRMLLARMLNWPPTLAHLGYPLVWDSNEVLDSLKAWRGEGNKVFNSAYIVSTNGQSMDKLDYIVLKLDEAHQRFRHATPVAETLAETHSNLMSLDAVGSFMAAQVVADLKNTNQLALAPDWHIWAAPGPGSLRGLNRVCGLPLKKSWRGQTFKSTLIDLLAEVEHHVEFVPDLCLQDLQNCLCEFDKYQRIKEGGKVRSYYTPHNYPM